MTVELKKRDIKTLISLATQEIDRVGDAANIKICPSAGSESRAVL